jgi:hypothetical protein
MPPLQQLRARGAFGVVLITPRILKGKNEYYIFKQLSIKTPTVP